ncbi:MAG: hypothetical protein QM831_09510 [Kofleriaceae bacterium]
MKWFWIVAMLCATAGADTGGSTGGGNWQRSQPTPRIGRGGGGGGGGGGTSSSSFPDQTFDTSSSTGSSGPIGWVFLAFVGGCAIALVLLRFEKRANQRREMREAEARVRARFAEQGLIMPGDPGYVPIPASAPAPQLAITPAPTPVEHPRAMMLRFAIDSHARARVQAGLARSSDVAGVAALVLSMRDDWFYAGADDGNADAAFAQPRYGQRSLSQIPPTAPAANTGLVLVSIYVVTHVALPPVREVPSGIELCAALEAVVALSPADIVRSSISWNPSNTELEVMPRNQREPEFIAMRPAS